MSMSARSTLPPAALGGSPVRGAVADGPGTPDAGTAPTGADTTVPFPTGGATAPAAGAGTAPAARRREA